MLLYLGRFSRTQLTVGWMSALTAQAVHQAVELLQPLPPPPERLVLRQPALS